MEFKIKLPKSLEKKRSIIEDSIKSQVKNIIESTIDMHSRWQKRDSKFLKCKHNWVLIKDRRTSMYDTEDVTECTICGCEIDVYERLVRENKPVGPEIIIKSEGNTKWDKINKNLNKGLKEIEKGKWPKNKNGR